MQNQQTLGTPTRYNHKKGYVNQWAWVKVTSYGTTWTDPIPKKRHRCTVLVKLYGFKNSINGAIRCHGGLNHLGLTVKHVWPEDIVKFVDTSHIEQGVEQSFK